MESPKSKLSVPEILDQGSLTLISLESSSGKSLGTATTFHLQKPVSNTIIFKGSHMRVLN